MAYRFVVNAFRGEERPELVVEEVAAVRLEPGNPLGSVRCIRRRGRALRLRTASPE